MKLETGFHPLPLLSPYVAHWFACMSIAVIGYFRQYTEIDSSLIYMWTIDSNKHLDIIVVRGRSKFGTLKNSFKINCDTFYVIFKTKVQWPRIYDSNFQSILYN